MSSGGIAQNPQVDVVPCFPGDAPQNWVIFQVLSKDNLSSNDLQYVFQMQNLRDDYKSMKYQPREGSHEKALLADTPDHFYVY